MIGAGRLALYVISGEFQVKHQLEFFTNAQYRQKWQYWHHRLYYVKTKKIQQQNVTPLSTELTTSAIHV